MKKVFSLLFILALTGCYQLGEIRPTSMRSIHKLAVPTFRNSTLTPRVEVRLADITIRMLQNDGTYEIVPEDKADAILECKLVEVSRLDILSSTTNIYTTQQFSLQIKVEYQVLNRITGTILQSGTANGTTTYYVTNDLVSDERQAFPLAARVMATSLVNQLTQGW